MHALQEEHRDQDAGTTGRRSVLIPIVPLGPSVDTLAPTHSGDSNTTKLIEVHSERYNAGNDLHRQSDENASRRDLDPVAATLRPAGLYQAGCAAAGAARKLGLRRPWLALYQLFRPRAWIEGQRLVAFSAEGPEGNSAELGLALALLMNAAGTPQRCVFATGSLSRNPGSRSHDVEIVPVGGLPEKLRRVIQHVREKGLPGGAEKPLFFTPTTFEKDGIAAPVRELAEIQELSRLGVEVVPVAWLSEAARALGAHRTRYLALDWVALGLTGIGFLGAIGLWGYLWWRNAPIPMAYLPADPNADPAPFIVCLTGGGYQPLPLRRDGSGHVIPVHSPLGWRVQVGGAEDSWLAGLSSLFGYQGYYLAQIMVSESSPSKVNPSQLADGSNPPLRVPLAGVWEQQWDLNEKAESNGLVLLAQRHAPFDSVELQNRLLQRFPQAAGNDPSGAKLDVSAAVNFLSRQAPGAVAFIFRTAEEESACNP